VVQHKLYWATAGSIDEARYLSALLNSVVVAKRVAPYQSRGQFGARDFDLYVWYLPIPEYDPAINEHRQLAELGRRAEDVAASVQLPERISFQTARSRVRDALDADGVANAIERVVGSLIPPE